MTLEQLYTQLGSIQFQLDEISKAKKQIVMQIQIELIAQQAQSNVMKKDEVSKTAI
jgi:hypothetical protein